MSLKELAKKAGVRCSAENTSIPNMVAKKKEEISMSGSSKLNVEQFVRRMSESELAKELSTYKLKPVKTKGNGAMIVPFSIKIERAKVHLFMGKKRRNIQCVTNDCPFCDEKILPKIRYLVAVYDANYKEVRVLSMNDSNDDDALCPQVWRYIENIDLNKPKLIYIRLREDLTYEVNLEADIYQDDPISMDREIAKFNKVLKLGKIELKSIIPIEDRKEMAKSEDIVKRRKIRGEGN